MSAYLINVDNEHSLTSDAFPDFKVYVEIEGKPAQVYGVDSKRIHGVADNKSKEELQCAIEGKSGARFATRVRDFQFGSVPHTDKQEEAVKDDEVISSVATISVKLLRCKDIVESKSNTVYKVTDIAAKIERDVLNEKDKKAQFAYSCSAGEERILETAISFVDFVGLEDEPFVQYTFTVWSRAGLEIKKYIEEDVKPCILPPDQTQAKKRTRSTSDSPVPQASSSKVKVAKKNKAAQEVIKLEDDDKKPGKLQLDPQAESESAIRRGKTLYIDFDEEEVEEAEKKKA
ncbi:hypothetical protein JCM3765_001703 [Sporobolomyces pararoseus]